VHHEGHHEEDEMTEFQQRLDKGMVLIDQPAPTKHARLMPVVFPELPEAAAVEMHGVVPRGPALELTQDAHIHRGTDADADEAAQRWRRLRKGRF
jgi:hypothetical protein